MSTKALFWWILKTCTLAHTKCIINRLNQWKKGIPCRQKLPKASVNATGPFRCIICCFFWLGFTFKVYDIMSGYGFYFQSSWHHVRIHMWHLGEGNQRSPGIVLSGLKVIVDISCDLYTAALVVKEQNADQKSKCHTLDQYCKFMPRRVLFYAPASTCLKWEITIYILIINNNNNNGSLLYSTNLSVEKTQCATTHHLCKYTNET